MATAGSRKRSRPKPRPRSPQPTAATSSLDSEAQIAAINRSLAVCEFAMDGTILHANDNFLELMGYSLEELQGQHHSIFVDPEYKISAAYKEFWENLNRGKFAAAEYKRLGKDGKKVWIQASYNPILDANGHPAKVVKYATDVTAETLRNEGLASQIAAINQSQAVCEFALDGTIITANDNFLATMGYTLEEIRGRHHSMFVDEAYGNSEAYKQFWETLRRGEFLAAEFQRVGKGGREVWIQGAYNPIFDLDGAPCKVIKYAIDITAEVQSRQRVNQLSRVFQDASDPIIIENLEGVVLAVNRAVERDYGWTSDDLVGKPIKTIVPRDRHPEADHLLHRCRAGEEVRNVEGVRVTRQGREFPVLLTLSLLTDDTDQPTGVVSFAKEITALKQAEDESRADGRPPQSGHSGRRSGRATNGRRADDCRKQCAAE